LIEGMSFSNHHLKIKARTWNKDSYGLFDYETTHYHSQTIKTTHASNLFRLDQELNLTNCAAPKTVETMTNLDAQELLAQISECPEGIKISCPSESNDSFNHFWQKIDNQQNNDRGHLLKVDDVFKLGRTIMRVKQIKLEEPANNANIYRHSIFNSIKQHHEDKKLVFSSEPKTTNTEGFTCKICLADQTEESDPLISPCNCSGSVSHVHFKCLQNWIASKLNMQKNKNIININWQRLHCELCKAELPLIIKHDGSDFLLISCNDKMLSSYAMLEFFSKENDSIGIFIIDISSNGKYKIGRAQDSDIQASDISISRVHSTLNVVNGKLYIQDNSSRFGTLTQLREPIILNLHNLKSPWLQSGRTSFQFVLDKPWISMIPCLGSIFNIGVSSRFEDVRKTGKRDTAAFEEIAVKEEDDDEIFEIKTKM